MAIRGARLGAKPNRKGKGSMTSNQNDIIQLEITRQQIIEAVKKLSDEERENLIEDLLAQASPDYLESIREAREDYRQGRILSHEKVFNKV